MGDHAHVVMYLNNKLKEHPDTTNEQWYVGIASDVEARLFSDHNVYRNEPWATSEADTEEIARSVEKHFLDAGCDGGPGGGDSGTKIVYVYLKSSRTTP